MEDIEIPANNGVIIHKLHNNFCIITNLDKRKTNPNTERESLDQQINELFKNEKPYRDITQNKIWKIILTIILTVFAIAAAAILLWLFVFKKKKEEEDEKNYQDEKLIVKLNYIPNNLLKFRSEKIINLEVKTDESEDNNNNMNKNNTKNITQYTDFIFIIREKKDEKDENNLIVKNIYTGYII